MNTYSLRRLSEAEILREAELIRAAMSISPQSPHADILSPARELSQADEDRVVHALEEMRISESE